jgi:hypothetical protein
VKEKQRREAQELLDNAWLKGYIAQHRANMLNTWEAAETTAEREQLHARIRALSDFSEELYATARRITDTK